MGAFFFSRNFSLSLNFGVFHWLDCFGKRRILKDSFFLCKYSSVSAVSFIRDSDSWGSNSGSNSESESLVLGENISHHKNIHLFSSVVRLAKSLNWVVARKISFTEAVSNYGFDHSTTAFRIILHVFACAGMELEVFALLRDIISYYQRAERNLSDMFYTLLDWPIEVEGSTFVVNTLIKVFASNMLLENAFEAFDQAVEVGLQPGIRACNFFLKSLVEANKRMPLETLFERMKSSGPFPNVYTYTIMMNFYCNKNHGEDIEFIMRATDILEEMDAAGISPSNVTYSTYILGLCRFGTKDAVIYLNALDIIRDLRDKGRSVNCYCYNCIISGFVNIGDLCRAEQVFYEMKVSGIAPDAFTFSILIEGFCTYGYTEIGILLFEEMENCNFQPSLFTYCSLMKALCRSGSMEKSFDLFQKARNSGLELDPHAYNILITGFCVQGDMDSAYILLEDMISNGMSPNAVSYNSLILGFCKIGSFDKAIKGFRTMLKAGFMPNTVVFNHVIHGYCNKP